ncbi:MAG: helix-turn-helix domain-containing protein [Thiobacillaceae bacterium]|nr:helix-turn-helix domain-containing protein [Thiobacillaceae bacterium]
MAYLQQKWTEYSRLPDPPRRYSHQREFEADWVGGLRRRYGLSQEALAALACVSVTTVQNWENPASRKNIAPHNQERLREIERALWMQAHVTLLEPCPPHIRALHDLLMSHKDASAQGLAEYLLQMLPPDDPERARVLHWAGLAHSISDPASAKARAYQQAALAAVGNGDRSLAAAIENEILGSHFEDLLAQPAGPERQEKARWIMAACERLFERDGQPAYLWNALEVACRAPLPEGERYRLVERLNAVLGEARVRSRIEREEHFAGARALYTTAGPAH